jgi:hypothetical protein
MNNIPGVTDGNCTNLRLFDEKSDKLPQYQRNENRQDCCFTFYILSGLTWIKIQIVLTLASNAVWCYPILSPIAEVIVRVIGISLQEYIFK